jgi:hypothetical protein
VKMKTDHLKTFDEWIQKGLTTGKVIKTLDEIAKYENDVIVVNVDFGGNDVNWEKISLYFRIWHSTPIRGEYKGVVVFKFANNVILCKRAPQNGIPVTEFDSPRVWNRQDRNPLVDIKVGNQGESCVSVCGTKSCDLGYIGWELNHCHALRQHMECKTCGWSQGTDLPALDFTSGQCLWNQWSQNHRTTCEGKHEKTKRLCACHDPLHVQLEIEKEQQLLISQ